MNKQIIQGLICVAALSVVYGSTIVKGKNYGKYLSGMAPVAKFLNNHQTLGADSSACNTTGFDKCSMDFAKDLNLDMKDITNSKDFTVDIFELMDKYGIYGFEYLCKAVNALEDCMNSYGTDQYDICFDVNNLRNMSLEISDAYAFAAIAQEFKYECGPGYKAFHDNFDCISKDLQSDLRHLLYCQESFINSVKQDSDNECPESQVFANCYMEMVTDCGSDVVQAMCEMIQAGFKATSDCKIICSQQEFK